MTESSTPDQTFDAEKYNAAVQQLAKAKVIRASKNHKAEIARLNLMGQKALMDNNIVAYEYAVGRLRMIYGIKNKTNIEDLFNQSRAILLKSIEEA